MKRLVWLFLGYCGAILVFLTRLTLRFDVVDDPRPSLRAAGDRYVYAVIHAHQINFVLVSDDVPIAAMVSASKDGDVLVPACRVRSIIACRGSTRKPGSNRDKGGRRAFDLMKNYVQDGIPAFFVVDGPRGPRNYVNWGVVDLAHDLDAKIIVAGIFPKSRIILPKTWDRTQVPLPFTIMRGRFRSVINPKDFPDRDSLRRQVCDELIALEQEFDPEEAKYAVGLDQPSDIPRSQYPAKPGSDQS